MSDVYQNMTDLEEFASLDGTENFVMYDSTKAQKATLSEIKGFIHKQADWAQGSTGADDYIKNKPTITYDSTNKKLVITY